MGDALAIVDGGMAGLLDELLDSGLADRQPLFTTYAFVFLCAATLFL